MILSAGMMIIQSIACLCTREHCRAFDSNCQSGPLAESDILIGSVQDNPYPLRVRFPIVPSFAPTYDGG